MHHNFFSEALQTTAARIAPTQHPAQLNLDKNEQSNDVDAAFKQRVMERLMQAEWNRYPAADQHQIETKVADYCGLSAENIVLSPGSANMITTLLNYFALNQKHIVIGQPSYSLFDYHCKTYNIPYEPWLLNENLTYDLDNPPALGPNSVCILTSPNNPVGNTLSLAQLENLLNRFPETYIIIDGVYTEFSEVDPTPLVQQYPNLMVLRSFSKAFPIAGLRFGYLCASPATAAIVKKLVLPFSVNYLTLAFVEEMLNDRVYMDRARTRVQAIVAERERMYHNIRQRFGQKGVQVFQSEGNFLLIRVHDDLVFKQLMETLPQHGIKVLNTANAPLLHNTFRVSIGTAYENEAFFAQLSDCLAPFAAPAPVFEAPLVPAMRTQAGIKKALMLDFGSRILLSQAV